MSLMNNLTIRREQPKDYAEIRELVTESFARAEHTDGDEHNLIDRIRQSDEYIPELALVAVSDGKIVGYIMFSRISVGNDEAVALAPLAVIPDLQRKGIGKSLIETGHRIASELGYKCSLVLGYPDYYSRFGYSQASDYNVFPPFDIPEEYFMICPLNGDECLPQGIVRYSGAFGL